MKKIFYSKLWGLMLPIVLQNLMLALVAVADAFMLGGMDQNYMSAVSLATQIQFIWSGVRSMTWRSTESLVQAVIPYLICTALPSVCGASQSHWQLQEHITSTGRLWSFMPVPASMKSANCPGCFTISGSISGWRTWHIEKMFIKKILLILYQKDFFCGNQASSIV